MQKRSKVGWYRVGIDKLSRRVDARLCVSALILLVGAVLFPPICKAGVFQISGSVSDPAGDAVPGAVVDLVGDHRIISAHTVTDSMGRFKLATESAGDYQLMVNAPGFQTAARTLSIGPGNMQYEFDVSLRIIAVELVTVTSEVNQVDLFSPDPAERVFVQQNLIDANPGRPGAPVSIPGFPIETASGGIKAPQYFAPGVAADHGEPIAQFIAVGGYLLPNNLSANAHGNGYADPNILIPEVLADVQVNGGSFNVLEGNHALNLAATYGLRPRIAPFLNVYGDYRDIDIAAGLNRSNNAWLAFEGSYGNGFLDRLEHRQQYKVNGERIFEAGPHRLTLVGIGYYGASYIPGLVPIGVSNPDYLNVGDTIDPRQREQTHTALLALNDEWTVSGHEHCQFSGFFRTYNLSLYSDFGHGLIRQSEFRTVAGGSANYANDIRRGFSLLAGLDVQREAPRRDDLDHYDFYTPGYMTYGPFTKVTANDVTITPVAPYAAIEGAIEGHLRYYLGWRRDQIDIDNQDLVQPGNSFHEWVGVNSPKATVSIIPGSPKWAPIVAASASESFFTEDPRIGAGTTKGTPISRAHSYQLVASKLIWHTDLKLTLGRVSTTAQLAKIDPDTGLQEDEGPGRLRFLTAAVRQNFHAGSMLVTFSKADARDIDTGQPTAEAPRTILDILGVTEKLPMRLQAKGEFEFVGAKPLGTGCNPEPGVECVGVAVREFRGAVARPFREGRINLGLNLLVAHGFTGQTLETFYPSATSEVTGIRIPSYAGVSFTYRIGSHPPQ